MEALSGAKSRSSELEKMIYTVVMASQKLKYYFTTHPITIPTAFPLQEMLANWETTGRISMWAAELAPLDLTLFSRTAVKSWVLTDFMVKWNPTTSSTDSVAPLST